MSEMRRWTMSTGLAVLLLIGLLGSSPILAAEGKFRIGITQIVEHPALDAAKQGFIDELAALVMTKASGLRYAECPGDFATAGHRGKIRHVPVDLILAIATPTAQAANVTQRFPS